MTSRSLARLFAIALIAGAPPASADTLVLGDRLVYGRLISVESASVRFAPDCGAEQVYSRGEVKQIERNGACRPRPIRPYSAGSQICATPPLVLYEVVLESPKAKFLVSDAAIANGGLHLRSVDGLMAYHGADKRFVGLACGKYCREGIAETPTVPGFCAERVPWAVNYGPEPVFDNRILTRGLSFYLEDDRSQPIAPEDPRSQEVRKAFGNAVAQWMGTLQDSGPDLPAPARAAFQGMLSKSTSGYVLMTPPQVVRAGCHETASFVVRHVTRSAEALTVGGQVKAARAQVEGRTLWINGATYPCWRAALTDDLVFPKQSQTDPTCLQSDSDPGP